MNPVKHLAIGITVMPWEVDAYRALALRLKQGIRKLPGGIETQVGVCLVLSDDIIDWQRSPIGPEVFTDSFNQSNVCLADVCELDASIDRHGRIRGCVDQRRAFILACPPDSHTLWLDPDMIFDPVILEHLVSCVGAQPLAEYHVITPRIPRMWDESWDVLVHPDFKTRPLGSCYGFQSGDLEALYAETRLPPRLTQLDQFKFAGGWLTLFSSNLLKLVDIPASFHSYGREDTFIMKVCTELSARGLDIRQYVLENSLVAQDFSLQQANAYLPRLPLIHDKQAGVQHNKRMTPIEIERCVQRVTDGD